MFRRRHWLKSPLDKLSVSIFTDGRYRPGVVLEDGAGRLVRVRYCSRGELFEGWFPRGQVFPPQQWGGPKAVAR